VKSAVESLSATRVRISIDIDFTDLEPHVKTAYQSISERIVIPGFRKGKVPRQMIDQRVGRGAVLDEAINSALPEFYAKAARENEVLVVGRPSVDIKELKDNEVVKVEVEVDIRPEIALPDFSSIEIKVDDVAVTEKDIDDQLEALRIRFGTLTSVEKKVESGDFVSIDLNARIEGKEVEGGAANGISYEVGSNRMIDGLDEALIGMSAGETKSFSTRLVGMKEGETGEVEVKLEAVKKRELPDLNDEFAKLSSEFDNLGDLKKDLEERLTRVKSMEQGTQSRDVLLKHLLDTIEIPVPAGLIEDEVHEHLEKESRLDDEAHRKEVTEELNQSIRADFLLDAIVKAEEVQVSEGELTEYIVRAASRYGMSPEQFAMQITQGGQISTLMAEVARTKALSIALEKVKIKDASGRPVDLSQLVVKPAEAVPSE
jgi:trigger factor